MNHPLSWVAADAPSQRTPTGRPTGLRHFVGYHNPDRMRYEFHQVNSFAVLTDKRYRDLEGSVVWCVGRLGGTSEYYLDARFRIERVDEGPFQGFRFRVSASTGFLFFPADRIDTLSWFQRLRRKTANFVGLQSLRDPTLRAALEYQYEVARYIQGLRPGLPTAI